jgi:hypothetical protein
MKKTNSEEFVVFSKDELNLIELALNGFLDGLEPNDDLSEFEFQRLQNFCLEVRNKVITIRTVADLAEKRAEEMRNED